MNARAERAAGLARAIRLPHATAMVAGTIIGASIFVQPSEVTGRIPSPEGALLVWLVAGILTLFGCLVTAQLASIYRESGGVYVFLREAYSPLLGFLWGWAMFWTMHSGIIAAIAVVFARYLAWFAPLGPAGTRWVAIGAIVALSAVNYAGVRHGTALQTAFTAIKVGAIVLMVAVGFALGPAAGGGEAALAATQAGTVAAGEVAGDSLLGGASPSDLLLALVAGLFAYGGWHMVTYSAEETVEPERTIPRSLLVGVGIVTACYLALAAVYFHVLPLDTVIASDRVAADAADAVLGRGGGATMSGLVVFSTFGALAGIVLAGPRVYYAMARDGLLFRWLGAVHPSRRTPHRAIALQAVWASALVWTETYRALFTRVIYTEWIFFGLMAVGLLLVQRRAGGRPRYAAWTYPWVPAIFALSAFAIVVNQVAAEPGESASGLGLVLLGVPVYWIARSRARWIARAPARRRPTATPDEPETRQGRVEPGAPPSDTDTLERGVDE
ncbi:MAG: APC family permease [Gemmatimonadota bacterium]